MIEKIPHLPSEMGHTKCKWASIDSKKEQKTHRKRVQQNDQVPDKSNNQDGAVMEGGPLIQQRSRYFITPIFPHSAGHLALSSSPNTKDFSFRTPPKISCHFFLQGGKMSPFLSCFPSAAVDCLLILTGSYHFGGQILNPLCLPFYSIRWQKGGFRDGEWGHGEKDEHDLQSLGWGKWGISGQSHLPYGNFT